MDRDLIRQSLEELRRRLERAEVQFPCLRAAIVSDIGGEWEYSIGAPVIRSEFRVFRDRSETCNMVLYSADCVSAPRWMGSLSGTHPPQPKPEAYPAATALLGDACRIAKHLNLLPSEKLICDWRGWVWMLFEAARSKPPHPLLRLSQHRFPPAVIGEKGGTAETLDTSVFAASVAMVDLLCTSRQRGGDGSQRTGTTVNARMFDAICKTPAARDWTARQWAQHLGCSAATVVNQPTWKQLARDREAARNEWHDQRSG